MKSKNTSKNHPLLPSRLHHKDSGMGQQIQISICNEPYKQTDRQNHMIILLDSERAIDKIQHSFIIKFLGRLEKQGSYLNIRKVVCSKPMAYINLTGQRFKAVQPKSGARQTDYMI